MSRLVGLSATDIRERQLKCDDTTTFPHELQVLLNKTYAFKIQISSYNLENPNGSYTVYKLSDDPYVTAQLAAQDTTTNDGSQEPSNAEVLTAHLDEDSQIATDSKVSIHQFNKSLNTVHSNVLGNIGNTHSEISYIQKTFL